MAFSGAEKTRFSLSGLYTRPAGDFTGKATGSTTNISIITTVPVVAVLGKVTTFLRSIVTTVPVVAVSLEAVIIVLTIAITVPIVAVNTFFKIFASSVIGIRVAGFIRGLNRMGTLGRRRN